MLKIVKHLLRLFNPAIIERYQRKLMAGVLLAMAAFVPAVGIAAILLSAIGDEQNKLALFNHREFTLSQDLQTPLENEDRLMPLFILTGDRRFLDQLEHQQHDFDVVLARLAILEASDTRATQLLSRIAVLAQRRRTLGGPGITMRIQGEPIQNVNHYFEQNIGFTTADLHRAVASFQQLMRAQFEDFVARQHRKLHGISIMLLTADCFAVIVCAVVSLVMLRLLQSKREHDALLVQQADWQQALATARKEAIETMAHDLRQPLQVIMFAAEKLQREKMDKQSTQVTLEGFVRSASAMRRLIDSVLHPAISDAGTLTIFRKPLDLHELLQDVFSRFRLTAAAADVELIYIPDPRQPHLVADTVRLDQVVANLLANAIKFSVAGDSVTLTASSTETWVTIIVKDIGRGMSQDQVEQVFSRYWRGGTAPEHGSGLGLAISKAIVDAHKGRIDVSSVPGQGTVFKVHLPVDPAMMAKDGGQHGAAPERHPTRSAA